MTGTCRGCRIPRCLLDREGLCHDCAWYVASDPDVSVDDLAWVMPGPTAGDPQ